MRASGVDPDAPTDPATPEAMQKMFEARDHGFRLHSLGIIDQKKQQNVFVCEVRK